MTAFNRRGRPICRLTNVTYRYTPPNWYATKVPKRLTEGIQNDRHYGYDKYGEQDDHDDQIGPNPKETKAHRRSRMCLQKWTNDPGVCDARCRDSHHHQCLQKVDSE